MTNSNLKITTMAEQFDLLLPELSQEAQDNLNAMVQELAKEVLAQGAGEMSAKELVMRSLIAKQNYLDGKRWDKRAGCWQRHSVMT